jgi:hypothetical protein
MFFVYAFSNGLMDFEVVGGFSKRDEAEALLATIETPSKAVVEQTWKDVIDHATTVRLGDLAQALRVPADGEKPIIGQHLIKGIETFTFAQPLTETLTRVVAVVPLARSPR